jgi:hypothetical protein
LDPGIANRAMGKRTSAATKYGTDWVAVAALVPGRTNERCRHRWLNSLNITQKMGKWTPEDDAKLNDAVTKYGKHWPVVATLVPGRTNLLCRERWVQSLHPSIDGAMVTVLLPVSLVNQLGDILSEVLPDFAAKWKYLSHIKD